MKWRPMTSAERTVEAAAILVFIVVVVVFL